MVYITQTPKAIQNKLIKKLLHVYTCINIFSLYSQKAISI